MATCLFVFQDNNGVIGLLEALKTSRVPVKVPMLELVVKIASGKKPFFPVTNAFICNLVVMIVSHFHEYFIR